MKSKWPQRIFIDLFAGPGKNQVETTEEIFLGSPLLALLAKYPFVKYYYSDLNSENVAALKQRCIATPHSDLVQIYPKDANKIVSTIVADIKQYYPHSLCLAFLDPEGLELEWSTIVALGSLRCDLIIHY